MNFRIGFGVDVHQLASNRKLVIGGIDIPNELGAVGHSDADVLIHAICDAMLGATNSRDIGYHFPDKDPKYAGADSAILLKKVNKITQEKGFQIVNIDSTIILEMPKLSPFINQMQDQLANVLNIESNQIAIKATTHEKMDSFGENKAIKAYAVCLLSKKS